MRRATLLLLMAALASCAGCAPMLDRIPRSGMAPRLQYQGFSFDRPASDRWYMKRSEESYADVTLRRDTGSETHSFYARMSLASIARQPTSKEDFAALIRDEPEQHTAPYEVRSVANEQSVVIVQNQWCIRLDKTAIVHGAPVAPADDLRMILRGFRCLHPAFPRTTLDFFYSERGLASEMDPALAAEGEAFLKGVRIDVAPGTPAG